MNFLRAILVFSLLILQACSCGNSGSSRATIRIGIDPNWYPLDFGVQTSYVNGYTEDLLLEIARYTGVQFEKIEASWDNLFEGLREDKYDAVFSSLPAHEHSKATYDFSTNFLDLGPVLIIPSDAEALDFEGPKGAVMGIIADAPTAYVLEKYPAVVIRSFKSIPDLLNAVVDSEVEGALLPRIFAMNYVKNLYAGKLKVTGDPLTHEGLHLVALKKNERAVSLFDKSLKRLKKSGALNHLQKKWQLD